MEDKYYNYQEWKKACTQQGYIIEGAYSLAGDKKIRHRYVYNKAGEIMGEFIHDKKRSWGYLSK